MKLGWKDLTASIDSHGGSTGPTWKKFRDGLYLYAFPSNSPREILAHFHIPHDYALGTKIYPHIHFTVNSNRSGYVKIGFEYSIAKGHNQGTDSIFDSSKLIFVTQYINGIEDRYKHFIVEVSDNAAIEANLLEPDTIVLMRIFRDANSQDDTYEADVFGITVDVHYQSDKESTKNKKPNFFE
jgi:hypothetical protein